MRHLTGVHMKRSISVEEQEDIVLNAIAKEFDVPRNQLQPGVSLVGDLKADSLALINVVMQIEEALSIDIPDAEWRTLLTVGDILERIRTIPPAKRASADGRLDS